MSCFVVVDIYLPVFHYITHNRADTGKSICEMQQINGLITINLVFCGIRSSFCLLGPIFPVLKESRFHIIIFLSLQRKRNQFHDHF